MSNARGMTEPGNPPRKSPDEPTHWLVRPETIRKLWIGSAVILAITVAGDFFVEHYEYFGIDASFGFYAWYGFGACVAMVLGAKLLGIFLKREDTYYEGSGGLPKDEGEQGGGG